MAVVAWIALAILLVRHTSNDASVRALKRAGNGGMAGYAATSGFRPMARQPFIR